MKPTRPKRTRQRASAKGGGRPQLSPDALKAIQEAIGYKFKDTERLTIAMTHPSALSAEEAVRHSNQRLEFLGDRVLNLCIAERLIRRRLNEREGQLAPRLNRQVKKKACADAIRHVDIGKYIIMSPGEIAGGGRERDTTLGDVCEAVIGAIFMESGLAPARKFIEKAWAPQFRNSPKRVKDAKTLVQEWAQSHGHDLPDYRVKSRKGPDHAPHYAVKLKVAGAGEAIGEGTSKQDAERAAASAFLDAYVEKL